MNTEQTKKCVLVMVIYATSLVNKYAVASSQEDCQKHPDTLWDITRQRCLRCLTCPPGTGYTGVSQCGYGVEGVLGGCPPCDDGQFQPKDGRWSCINCTDCSSLNRFEIDSCTRDYGKSHDAKCGDCYSGHVLSPGDNATCVPCVDVPGCQTDEPTTIETINATVTSSYYIESTSIAAAGNLVEPTPTVKEYWWVFFVAGILVAVIITACVVCRTRRPSSPTNIVLPTSDPEQRQYDNVDIESGNADGRPVQRHADNTDYRETTPFIAMNLTDGMDTSRSSSGYISQANDELYTFPRDANLRRRYEKAMELLGKNTRCNVLVTECKINILQQLSTALNPDRTSGTQNWENLGSHLEIPNRTLDNFKRETDPLLCVLKFTDARDALKLDAFLPKLKCVENHKALDIVVGYVLEHAEKHKGQNDEELGVDKDSAETEPRTIGASYPPKYIATPKRQFYTSRTSTVNNPKSGFHEDSTEVETNL